MPITFSIEPAARLVSAVVTPPQPTGREFAAFLDAVLAHPDHRPGFTFLYDRRGAGPAESAYIWRAANAIIERVERLGEVRWAILVADEAVFGMARMSGLTTAPFADILPFYDEAAARAWLAGGPRPF